MESHAEVMYPSITVCSVRGEDEYRNKSDLSLFQRSVNLSTSVLELRLYRKNDTGHMQKMTIHPSSEDMEKRDCKLFLKFYLVISSIGFSCMLAFIIS